MAAAWGLAIDFGTTATAAAMAVDGQLELVRIGGDVRMPSMVFLREGSADTQPTLVLGREAEHWAAADPSRLERAPKRRVGDQTFRLGDTDLRVDATIATILKAVADAAIEQRGGTRPSVVCLTCPARWGEDQREQLLAAAQIAGLEGAFLLEEPIAAAMHFGSAALNPGKFVAVYDLGGGTFDTAVLERTDHGFDIVGEPGGDQDIGGEEFDDRLYRYVGEELDGQQWQEIQTSAERPWRQANRTLQLEVRRAKEALSSNPDCPIYIPPPVDRPLIITAAELEKIISGQLAETVDSLEHTITEAGLTPAELDGIYLAGGSSRIPLVTRLIDETLGVVPRRLDDPKSVVVLGAARLVSERLRGADTLRRSERQTTNGAGAGASTANREDKTVVGLSEEDPLLGPPPAGAPPAPPPGEPPDTAPQGEPPPGEPPDTAPRGEPTLAGGGASGGGGQGTEALPSGSSRPRRRRALAGVGALVVVAGIAAAVVLASGGGPPKPVHHPHTHSKHHKTVEKEEEHETELTSAEPAEAVTNVPESAWGKASEGLTYARDLTALEGNPLVEENKPVVLFIGYEWCPHCVANSWALLEALSRFGTFSNLSEINSGTLYSTSKGGPADEDDVPGFTYSGGYYSSDYVYFAAYEAQDTVGNTLEEVPSNYLSIWDSLSPEGQPILDLGGDYWTSSPAFSPALLAGQSASTVAADLTDSSSEIGNAINSEANAYTAAICGLTGYEPENVCTATAVEEAEGGLAL